MHRRAVLDAMGGTWKRDTSDDTCVQAQCNRVTAEQRKTVVLGGKVEARLYPKYGSSVANAVNETVLRFHGMLAAIYMP